MLFQHVGRNTELDGKKIPNGDNVYIEDDRDLDTMFLGKFKRVKNAVGTTILTVDDLETPDRTRVSNTSDGSEVIDGGPHQPTAPNQSLDQRAKNSGVKPMRVQPPTAGGRGGKGGGGLQDTRPSPDSPEREEQVKEMAKRAEANSKANKKMLKTGAPVGEGGMKRKAATEGEHPGWRDVSEEYEKAGKADLMVVEYDEGGFQVFDADDKDDDDAVPLNKEPLKTKKAVNTFLDKYKRS